MVTAEPFSMDDLSKLIRAPEPGVVTLDRGLVVSHVMAPHHENGDDVFLLLRGHSVLFLVKITSNIWASVYPAVITDNRLPPVITDDRVLVDRSREENLLPLFYRLSFQTQGAILWVWENRNKRIPERWTEVWWESDDQFPDLEPSGLGAEPLHPDL